MHYNWSTDTTKLKKHPKAYDRWKLEQQVNYGSRGSKISKRLLKKYWSKLRISPDMKRFYRFLLWGKLS
jgi:hypothetical protein